MPLDADFTWKQTHTTVLLEVPLKGVAAKAVDIYGGSSKRVTTTTPQPP